MNKTVHIIFGNVSHRANYVRTLALNPHHVVIATTPELIQSMMKESVNTINVLRFPEEIWMPVTFPCEKRVAETERIIKGYQRLGVTVVEVDQ